MQAQPARGAIPVARCEASGDAVDWPEVNISLQSDLRAALPRLLPKAVSWSEARAADVLKHGSPLSPAEQVIAVRVGVVHPERIRVQDVLELPQPDDLELRQAAIVTGMLGPTMVGLTLGYAIYICHGHKTVGLLSHECRHVHQYEQAGSIAAFLPGYLHEILTFGYHNAPFEVDARAHEINDP